VLLDQNGLFLGPFPNATYENMSLSFGTGDTLLLYTDGITESPGVDGEEYGRQRLQEFLIKCNGSEPTLILDRLFQEIKRGPIEDDLTAVVVHFD
jgi:serine phosphatase RsbU (regulator of sigma subunit)